MTIGFGLERFAWHALRHPRIATVLFAVIVTVAAFGATQLRFDTDMRNVFASDSPTYTDYERFTDRFFDPENEILVLVEGAAIAEPETFARLQDLQFELQFVDNAESVFSPFALRERPDEAGNAAPLVTSTGAGLTPELAARIRAHPLLGDRLLTAARDKMVYVVTPAVAKASLAEARVLQRDIEATVDDVLGGAPLEVTVSGFPVIRADILDVLRRDQIVLNGVGAAIGLAMSFVVFRSVVGALLTAGPAIIGGGAVVGFMGLFGIPVTVMSNVIPAVVMILGYTDGMHLTSTFRAARNEGASVDEAEMRAQRLVGGACALAAVTTSVAFASLIISDVTIVRDFGATGAVATTLGTIFILVTHALMAKFIGRYWQPAATRRSNLLDRFKGPSVVLARFSAGNARALSVFAVALIAVMAYLHFSVPPQHSVREHLPPNNPPNAALGRIDASLGGIFPIQVVVPADAVAALSVEGLERVGRVHEAVAGVHGLAEPLSLWSLVRWLGGDVDAATVDRVAAIVERLSPAARKRFVDDSGGALVTGTIAETPTFVARQLVDRVVAVSRAAGGEAVTVTGVTVITVLESARTIDNLNISLVLSVVVNLAVIAFAFRSIAVGLVAFLPNILPIFATGAGLLALGMGMQFTAVVALTVTFGIAVDDTVHYMNRYFVLESEGLEMSDRLVETARYVGPVLFGTTAVLIAGLATTLTSGLPTITLFGAIAASALAVALIADLFFLPGLMRATGERLLRKTSATPTVGGAV